MEVAVLHKGNVRAKPADLPDHVRSNQQTRYPKAAKGFCNRDRRAAINSYHLFIVSSVCPETAHVHTLAVHQTCVRDTNPALVLELSECSPLPLKFFGDPNIIRIEERNVF